MIKGAKEMILMGTSCEQASSCNTFRLDAAFASCKLKQDSIALIRPHLLSCCPNLAVEGADP